MYKESINDKTVTMWRARKTNYSGNYVTDASWNMTASDNLRTLGEDVPGFHKKRRTGELLPFTGFLQLQNKAPVTSCDIEIRRVSDGWQSRHWGTGLANETVNSVSWTAASSIGNGKTNHDVIMQAAGARQASSGWDVLTFFAEVGQTVKMFKDLVTKVTDLAYSRPIGTPWNIWLEMRYGWRTLAYDIEDIEQAFSKHRKFKFNRTSAGQTITWVENTSGTASLEGVCTQNLYSKIEYTMNSRGRVISKIDPPRFQINILKTYWEVTRLSFVIDWFINVGRAIDALQFVMGNAYQAGIGDQVVRKYHGWRTFTPNAGYVMLTSKADVQIETIITRRGPASIPLIPLSSVNIDRFKVLDLVAILIQALRR